MKLFSSTKIDNRDILMLRERNLLNEYSDNTIAFNMIILSFKIVQKHYNHVVYVLMSRIVGDNWDLEVKARCQTKSQNNKSLHYFHAYAVTDIIIPKGLSNQRPQKGIDAEVQESILSDLCYMIPRVIAEYLPTYKTFRKAVHYHIPHAHSQEMTEKSEVVSCQCIKKCFSVTVC